MGNQSNAKVNVLIVLVALLVLAVAAQSYFLFTMHKELRAVGGAADSEREAGQSSSLMPGSVDSWFDDEWLNAPFDEDSWNPFEEMKRMQERMNRIFHESFQRFGRSSRFGHLYREPSFVPKLDMEEEEDRYVIRIDLPGADEAALDIQVEDRSLRVKGRRGGMTEESAEDGHVVRRERYMGQFDRSIRLPGPVDEGRMTTEFEDGVLTIILPKETK
ncbi:MAG: hypothetical protein Kow0099_36730 [Candidatus Abyssubacteria bacterium]